MNWSRYFQATGRAIPDEKPLMDYVKLAFPSQLLLTILQLTSQRIHRHEEDSPQRAPLTEEEFLKYLGLRIRMTLLQEMAVDDYWKTHSDDNDIMPVPPAFGSLYGMSRGRFRAIDRHLRWWEDPLPRSSHSSSNSSAQVRIELIEAVVIVCFSIVVFYR